MTNQAPRQKPLIMIVDDEEDVRVVLQDLMDKLDYDSTLAIDGHQALELFETQPPNLILLDIMMPKKSGLEVCKAIKQHPQGADIPILILTGLDDPDYIDEAFSAGASDYIVKPVHMGMLANRVNMILAAQQSNAALRSIRELTESSASQTPFQDRLLRHLPGMVYRSNHHPIWQMEYVSERARDITGYDPDHLIDNKTVTYLDLIHPDDQPKMWEAVNAALENHDEFDVKYRITASDGTEKWVREHGTVLPSDDPQQKIVEGYIVDITESKRIEDAILQERAVMRAMIDNLPHYIFVKDRQGKFIVSNMANAIYMGATHPNQIVGKKNVDFYPESLSKRFDLDDLMVMDAGQGTFHWEEEALDPRTGGKRWYHITKVPLQWRDGEVSGIVGMIRDMTESKKGEEEIRVANARLAELNQMKSHFLLKMSHELRTPLGVILGNTQMLLEGMMGTLEDKQSDRLQRVQHNAQELLDIINDMLDISKIQTEQMEVNLQTVDARWVLQQAVSAFEPLAETRGLTLSLDVTPTLPLLHTDSAALLKVMTHLTGNAIKFTEQGGVKIAARKFHPEDTPEFDFESDGRSWATIEISDTGIGISNDEMVNLFNEFWQVDNSPTREYGGTGLGLAISYKLVKLMQGFIWLDSEVGTGTTFKVILPCVS